MKVCAEFFSLNMCKVGLLCLENGALEMVGCGVAGVLLCDPKQNAVSTLSALKQILFFTLADISVKY